MLPLRDACRREAHLSGSKAAHLGELARSGYPVPDGFVLTTEAFSAFLAEHGPGGESWAADVAEAGVPREIAVEATEAAAALGDVFLAVRSSGVAEDLPDASFAGQYETVLRVGGTEALLAAVRSCWASVFGERVTAYRRARGGRAIAPVAVLVQRMIEADAAGVAFTANPVTGDRTETRVSAVRGLGGRLVSGRATPDEWIVRDGEAVCRRVEERVLDAAGARAVAELARRVETHFGYPQDVEWAMRDGDLHLLQARPITGLPSAPIEPVPVPVVVPEGFWQREASHAPRPWTPMSRVLFPVRNRALRRTFEEFGLLLETLEMREIGGWEYTRLVPLGGKDRRAPPPWLFRLLARVVPELRSRVRSCVEAVRSDKPARTVGRWREEWRAMLADRIAGLRTVELAALSDVGLDDHIASASELLRRGGDVHFLLHGALAAILGDLVFTCRDLLGWDEGRTFEMLNGLSERSTEPARRLARLARIARARPAVVRTLERIDDGTMRRLVHADPEFAGAFAGYQREYGCAALRYELAEPTLGEAPELVLALIRSQLHRRYDPTADSVALERTRVAAVAAARTALAARPASQRDRFERVLVRATDAYPVREDNEFYTLSAPIGLLRHGVLELGRRLAARGQLVDRDDVFFVELDEARSALRDGGDRTALVRRRKGERAWVLAHPGPPVYGKDPGPPPSFAVLPPEAGRVMESVLWYTDRIFAQERTRRAEAAAGTLSGIGASPGRYRGPVRVVTAESGFGEVQAGDVLVCPVTSPVWSVLFPAIGALVTDTGGILSHPAIIAREYRIPAVVATGRATHVLRDGQVVTVDGVAGVVEVDA